MATAAGIRAGKAYIEVGLRDTALERGIKGVQRKLSTFGSSVQQLGQSMLLMGGGAAAPFAASLKAFSNYQDALAAIRSAANPTAAEMEKINRAAMDLSRSVGVGPARVAAAMTELRKAGLPLETVLNDAARAALMFARVAEMDAAEAAVVLSDAINIFGVDAGTAIDTLSRAADASSISVRDVAMSFAAASAVARQAGLTIEETANAIAVLGNNGIKGSDAGTSLKTMLLRLLAPTEESAKVVKALGINVRTASGRMKDMRGIIAELQMRFAGLSAQARDEAMSKLFGTDAIRAGAILLRSGVRGWDKFTKEMQDSLPVAAKFDILMGTLSGQAERGWAAVERLAVAVGDALMPSVEKAVGRIQEFLAIAGAVIDRNKALVVSLAKGVAIFLGAGVALVGLGLSLKGAALAFGTVGVLIKGLLLPVRALTAAFALLGTTIKGGAIFAALVNPITLVTTALAGGAIALMRYTDVGSQALTWLGERFNSLKTTATQAFRGIADALQQGDIALAGQILWAALKLEWTRGTAALSEIWADWGTAFKQVFSDLSFFLAGHWTETWANLQSIMVKALNAMSGVWASWRTTLRTSFNDFLTFIGAITEAERDRRNEFERRDLANQMALQAQDAGAALADIEAKRQAMHEALADQQTAATEARRRKAQEDVAAAQKTLADAQQQFDELRKRAGVRVGAVDAAGGIGVPLGDQGGKKGGLPEEFTEGLGRALNMAKNKITVSGTFSAAALRGMGIGDTAADEQKETNRHLEGIRNDIRRNRPVWA